MVDLLVPLHVALGEAAGLAFLWAFVETLKRVSPGGARRAQWALTAALLFVVGSWVVGGFYYVVTYGSAVKPLIKAGPMPWAHLIFMEVKEHVFLFLPFLAATAAAVAFTYGPRLQTDASARRGLAVLTGLSALMVFGVAAMGFIVTSGYRDALESAYLAILPLVVIGVATAAAARAEWKGVEVVVSERVPLWSLGVATVTAMILVTILTVTAELNPGIKGWLAATFGHHWVGKGVLAVIAFGAIVAGSTLLRRSGATNVYRMALLTFSATFLLGAVLLIFYAIEYFL